MVSAVPYASATSGAKARDEVTKLLQRFGCENVGFMDNFVDHSVTLQFVHRGRCVRLDASAKGWAQMFLKATGTPRRGRKSQVEREQRALKQGLIAINSILRDWVKGQVTAVECGMMSFEAVFMPHMITNGRPLLDQIAEAKMLPPPRDAA